MRFNISIMFLAYNSHRRSMLTRQIPLQIPPPPPLSPLTTMALSLTRAPVHWFDTLSRYVTHVMQYLCHCDILLTVESDAVIIIIIIIIFWLKHQYLKHKYQSMVQQIIANMLSETVYTGITNLYIITKNQQNTKQYIINVNSVFWRA